MLTNDQITTFCHILTIQNDSSLHDESSAEDLAEANYHDESDVTQTRETLEHFVAANGQPDEIEEYFGQTTYIWNDLQVSKGKRRGTAIVTDFGEFRAAHFDGEI